CAVSDNTTNPTSQNDGASNAERDVACAEEFLERYGHRAFRRPMREAERQIFRELFADTYRTKGLEEGIVTLVQAMLQSPQFLYRFEANTATPLPEGGA